MAFTFEGLSVYGHSYSVGVGSTNYTGGIVDYLDVLAGGFSPVADPFTRADTATEADTFTRADSTTTLSSTETTAKAWTAYAGTWGIASNKARIVTGSGGKNVAAFDCGASDGAWFVKWDTAVGTGIGQCFRLVDASNYLYIVRSGATAMQLRKVVAGVDTQIGSDMAAVFLAGMCITVCLNGPQITVNYQSSSAVVPVKLTGFSDSTFQTATGMGLYSEAAAPTSTRWDDALFSYQELTASPTGAVVPTQVSGCWAVRSNALSLVSANGSHNIMAWDTGWYDGVIQFTIGTFSEAMGLAFRVQDESNYLRLSVSSVTGAWVLSKVVTGTVTQISSGVLAGHAAGQVVRVYLDGTRIRIAAQNSPVIAGPSDWTVTEFATNTKHGLHSPYPATVPVVYDTVAMSRIYQSGQGGSAVAQSTTTGSYVRVLQELPRLTSTDLAVTITGINDILGNTGTRGKKSWQEAMRAVIARFVAGTVYENTDASVAFTGTWSTITAADKNSGTNYKKTTTPGDYVTITVPGGFAGGTIQLGWLSPPNDAGGTATVVVDGITVATVTATGTFTATDYVAMVTRVEGLLPGAHTIVVTVNTVGATGFIFDYWAAELSRTTAPTVAVCNIARLTDYTPYGSGFGDADVLAYNVLLAAVVAEFEANVRLVDMDAAMGKTAANFYSDGVHPSDTGAALIAAAILAAVSAIATIIEVAFGSTWTTADVDLVWTDVTDAVLDRTGVTCTRGRRSVQDRFATGSLAATLLNNSRDYDPLNTAGPYYGQLVPGVPFRVTTVANVDGYPIFRGFVSGWPQRYDLGNTMATVPLNVFGVFDKLARAKLPQSAVDVEVLADTPVAYWKLDDNTEAEMLDSSGNDHHGTYDNPTLGQPALVADGGSAVFFDHVGDHRGKADIVTGAPTDFPATMECWVQLDRDLTESHRLMGVQRDTSYLSSVDLNVQTSAGGSPNGEAAFLFRGIGGFWRARGSTRIDDGLPHHLVLSMTSASSINLYVDGVLETLTTITGTTGGAWPNHFWWVVGNVLNNKSGDFGAGGNVDNVAIYGSDLSAGRALEHYNAGIAPWFGDTTDERLDRVLDVVGLPADRRDFDACTTLLGQTILGQRRALDYMRLVESSEDGRMFETADGRIRFLNRYWGVLDAHATTSQATFSDLGAMSYSDLQIDPDDELLVNVCTITRENAAALTVRNETSIDAYGEADTSVAVLLQTDDEARSLGEHIVLVRGTPEARVSKLRVPLHKYTPTQQATILALDIGYQITVNRTPQNVGSPVALGLLIEGVNHTINAFEHWVEFNVSVTPDLDNFFIWDTSTWDNTTTWGW